MQIENYGCIQNQFNDRVTYKMPGPSLYPNIKRSKSGYKINSKDNSEDQLIITSNKLTMKEDNGDPLKKGAIVGTGLTTGKTIVMKPGETYVFKGDKEVLETPLTSKSIQIIDGVLCDAYGNPLPPNYMQKKRAANVNTNYRGPGMA